MEEVRLQRGVLDHTYLLSCGGFWGGGRWAHVLNAGTPRSPSSPPGHRMQVTAFSNTGTASPSINISKDDFIRSQSEQQAGLASRRAVTIDHRLAIFSTLQKPSMALKARCALCTLQRVIFVSGQYPSIGGLFDMTLTRADTSRGERTARPYVTPHSLP